jgi:hypothetical protein
VTSLSALSTGSAEAQRPSEVAAARKSSKEEKSTPSFSKTVGVPKTMATLAPGAHNGTNANNTRTMSRGANEDVVTFTDKQFAELPDEEKARSGYARERRGSLRKQKIGAVDDVDEEGVEYMSHKRVADVIALSKFGAAETAILACFWRLTFVGYRDREKVSELQEIGFQRAANAGVNVDHAASQMYIENVGRAREVWIAPGLKKLIELTSLLCAG